MYKLSNDLIIELNKNQITYCHWKSNINIIKALGGYDDLDILVKKTDFSKFHKVLVSLNFKEALNKKLNIKSIKHYYGLDKNSGNILHLHIYTQILTGPSWTKSYRFEIHNEYFNFRKEDSSDMPLPPKSLELLIFVFRIYLKLSSGLEFFPTYIQRKEIVEELNYLTQDLNNSILKNYLKIYFPKISFENFVKYKLCLLKGNFFELIKYSLIIRLKLRKYQVYPIYKQISKSFSQFFYRTINKLLLKQKKNLKNGGIFIAITGLDASGKSSMVKKIQDWLSFNFTVKSVHFGRPKTTFITFPMGLLFKIYKIFKKDRFESKSKKSKPKKSLIYIIRQLSLAYDRYRLAINSIGKVSKGEIILCDRYKSENYFVMDSKRLDPSSVKFIKRSLAKFENSFYDAMPEPDIIINLTVPIDVAVKRNNERVKKDKESESALRERYLKNKNLTYKSKSFYNIDTNQNYNKLVNEVKSIIWSNI